MERETLTDYSPQQIAAHGTFFIFFLRLLDSKKQESLTTLEEQLTSFHLQSKRGQHVAGAATKRTFSTIKYAPGRRERLRQVTLASAAKLQREKLTFLGGGCIVIP